MAVRFVDPAGELKLFVEWVLADLTERKASGKRPAQAMISFWMTRPNLPGRRKLSDITERRYVALSALIQAGRSMEEALWVVCRHLGQETAKEREKVRVGYYDFKNSGRAVSMDMWRGYFYSWAEWVLTTDSAALKRICDDYTSISKQEKATWFSKFVLGLRPAAIVTECGRVLNMRPRF